MRHYIIPIFVPHSGCPHQCVFCNQKSISGYHKEVSVFDVNETINCHLKTLPSNGLIEVAFYGGSFTGIDTEVQEELLNAAYKYIESNKIKSIRISTRPDYINDDILNRLKKYGVQTIELGVQSMDNEVLSKSCRGHTADDVVNSSRLIKESGFKLGHQIMIGLPGDSFERDTYTAKQLVVLKPDIVRIYPTLVIKNTYLDTMYKKGDYIPLSLVEAVEISKQLLKLFRNNGINVIRLGLQVTDNINFQKDVVAGPFHPAFRELVESELRYEMIADQLDRMLINKGSVLMIGVNGSEHSITVGQKRKNLKRLYKQYGFSEIVVKPQAQLNRGQLKLCIDGNDVILEEK